MVLRTAAASLAFAFLAACAEPPGHDVFARVMDSQVGKQADEPDFYPVYYRLPAVDAKTLPNGNTEEQFRAGPRGECRVFFELSAGARRVVRWRAEGGDRDCVIVPRQP
jgi:hypothetical protein